MMNDPNERRDSPNAEPISDWENNSVKGLALTADKVFEDEMERVNAMRAQQQAYLDSLPSEPEEIIRAASKLMHTELGAYPDGFEEALHLSVALEALVKVGELDSEGLDRDAANYIAADISTRLMNTRRSLDRISDLLANPRRLEREKRFV